jgi:uncharacterized membrane protein YgdD (TMEM256/DUF423 family)
MGWTLVWGVIALAAAAFGARLVGRWLRVHPAKWYYGALVATALVAVALLFVSIAVKTGDPGTGDALWGVGLGLGCGGLAGLRYGYKGMFELPVAKAGS